MSICPNCNSQLPDGAAFCNSCGSRLNAAPAQAPVRNAHAGRLHCPNCKSHNISISTESSVDSAVSTHHGRFSSTHVSNTHRNFWFCSDCGTKFRSIQSLEEEIKKVKSSKTLYWVFAAIAGILFIYLLTRVLGDTFGFFLMPWTFGSVIALIIFIIGGVSSKSKLKKMNSELEYLRVNCFN